jgi:hypothetical protein
MAKKAKKSKCKAKRVCLHMARGKSGRMVFAKRGKKVCFKRCVKRHR